ncbi:hypothetical protein NE237_033115 [Protea cynaroides]|uniref:AATF leucine zipper-containing domain-containing protein n=1 Tax=Protea cynaroides TaxID=273540 RepID=A0A9Q0L498_9MAGN|nr:hypothetical protein NE237_033115 [Protea cynaroides]
MGVVSKKPRQADRFPGKKRRLDHNISFSEDDGIPEFEMEEGLEQVEQNSQQDSEVEEFSEDESDLENDAEQEQEQGEEEEEQQHQWEGHGSRQDAEMEELEKEYSNLRNQQLDLLENLKRHKDGDLLKGQAVKNQKVLWDKALELRFLLQKAFSSSNKLPQEPVRSSFLESDKAVDEAYSEFITSSKQTLDSLVELQEVQLFQPLMLFCTLISWCFIGFG